MIYKYGPVAQLGERVNGIDEATGSIPVCSTSSSQEELAVHSDPDQRP